MTRITVSASKTYPVYIGDGLLKRCGEYCRSVVSGSKILLLTDSNVGRLYESVARDSLETAGFEVYTYVVEAGETSKTAENLVKVVSYMAGRRFTRADAVVTLGGGVVGDLGGFCASTFLRGIGYVQVPTTLLACVDSSVGGKTAVNLPEGKNLFGTFYQPDSVLIDYTVLSTLPPSVYADGMAEVIKYGMIRDAALFSKLEAHAVDDETIIRRCVAIKAEIVESDEKERGLRRILNFGHTVGHAIEKASNFSVSHGSAVAVGMAIITRSLAAMNRLSAETARRLERVLVSYNLPVECEIGSNALYLAALGDKKRTDDTLNLVTVTDIGKSDVVAVPVSRLKSYIEAGRVA